MEFIEKHKAMLITVLIMGIFIMLLFGASLKVHTTQLAETYYELQPEKSPEEQLLEEMVLREALALNDMGAAKSTNKAFNEADYKEMMENFKSLNANDFKETLKQIESQQSEVEETDTDVEEPPSGEDLSVNESELSSYSKINEVIAKRSEERRKSAASNGDNSSNKTGANASANRNSSVSYSLKGRNDEHLPPPVYLCEESGKVVINISVNANGAVTQTSINRAASTSTNECLTDSALEYASNARFSASEMSNQLGSITYIFVAKN